MLDAAPTPGGRGRLVTPMSETLDRTGLVAGLETAGIAWREIDESERGQYAVDGVSPQVICLPASYLEAARALAIADQFGLAVSPRGGGSMLGLGNRPRAVDLVVSTERLNQIVDYAPANLTVTAEAGVTLSALQARLAEGGQYLPLDPPHADRATLGGIIATNASGPRRFGFGAARDLVIGSQAATTSGTVTKAGGRVVKNVAGYDLNKLYIGSLGTLVVLVELTFKVAPLPTSQQTVVGRFARRDQFARAVQEIIRSPLMPTAVEVFNAAAVDLVGEPGLPSPGNGYLLATLGTATGRAVIRQRDDLTKIYQSAGAEAVGTLADQDSARFWREVAEWPVRGEAGAIRVKAAVPIARVPDLVQALEVQTRELSANVAIGGRAGSGVLYASWTAESSGESAIKESARRLKQLRQTCREWDGSLVVEAAPAAVKEEIDVWGEAGSALPLMRRLKAALDPNLIMNPGRFVGGI